MPIQPTKLSKWKLLSSEDVSLSKHAPLEKRVYELPDGAVIDDFFVTTLADSVHIIPITDRKTVVMIRMYKPGVDEVMIQFPAGRFEREKHGTHEAAAVAELAEETGIQVTEADLRKLGSLPIMTTKATESAQLFVVSGVVFEDRTEQDLDQTEEIEVLEFEPSEIDDMIQSGEITDAVAIADWTVLRLKHPELFD